MEDFAAARPGGLISFIVYTKPKAANFLPTIGRERASVPPSSEGWRSRNSLRRRHLRLHSLFCSSQLNHVLEKIFLKFKKFNLKDLDLKVRDLKKNVGFCRRKGDKTTKNYKICRIYSILQENSSILWENMVKQRKKW